MSAHPTWHSVCPYEEGKFGHRDSHAQGEDDVKMRREKMAVWQMRLQAEDCWQTPEAGRDQEDPLRAF